ncbi:MAG: UvrD-helicase domain-containing protein [Prevotellaceae bacterium]|nr:UvrD-helicase domain-containing protein [Prevotellaceae bacterium]
MDQRDNILSQLNENQQLAVTYCDGPQLVIAGAGSGKTRVLTYKIAWLLKNVGLNPWNILALTFTNKAANEMKERIGGLVGNERARYLQMGTFHSVFARILRAESNHVGFTSNFTIYDEADSRSLIKNIVRQMGLDDKIYKPSTIHSVISMQKNRLWSAGQYAEDGELLERDRRRNMPETYKIFRLYEQRLQQANAMDFDDLLVQTYRLLKKNEDIRQKYAERFKYVLVDEYQDTNYAQQQIVWLLTKENQHITVVGDDYQSIYAFRGANINNILSFSKIYDKAKMFKLEQNYRSTQNIVAAANSLMKHNRRQIEKEVFSKNSTGEKVNIIETISDKREASIVCRTIKDMIRAEGARYSDFAILYRTNAQSRLFEEEMRKPEIGLGEHYRIYGGLSFYQRKEIKDIIAYFRLIVNPDDEEAFRRIINYPARGIGDTTVQKIIAAAQQHGVSLWEIVCNPVENELNVNRGVISKLTAFEMLIRQFMEKLQTADAYALGKEIVEKAGIERDLAADKSPEGDSRRENVDSLMSGIAEFVQAQKEDDDAEHIHLADYLSTVSLMTDIDSDSEEDSKDKITLMTIHAAKGLEFNTVFVVGLEENIFPSLLSTDNPEAIEEERRLLYVAITRAEKHCYLTWTHSRWRYGKMDGFVNPSRFLNDIDTRFTKTTVEGGRFSGNSQNTWAERDSFSDRLWSKDYEIDRPYTGYREFGNTYQRQSNRMQNSRPVAGQFMADPQPKVTKPRKAEGAVNPFSSSFERKLQQEGRWAKVSKAITNGGRALTGQNDVALREGNIIEHQRFGRGTVVKIEGAGENLKATVDFDSTGRKQLLLKFARYTIVG